MTVHRSGPLYMMTVRLLTLTGLILGSDASHFSVCSLQSPLMGMNSLTGDGDCFYFIRLLEEL